MIFNFHAVSAADQARPGQLDSSRREQIITIFAASFAMLVVATIAVLMGMI